MATRPRRQVHSGMGAYSRQHRGDRGAYERYLAGMDASMRQKVALTAAHFLCEGRVADMGMGSGTGSHAFAALYPSLQVVGVDISEEMVDLAKERYVLPNLSFVVGDVAARVFEAESLDGILSSSVLHHVTSFNGYDHDAATRALRVQAEQLELHGVLVVRDFVDSGRGPVVLELPKADGDENLDPRSASSARLFERFATEFRKLHAQPGFEYQALEDAPDGFARYRVDDTLATEFLLRKDYRADWESEVLEEYTYLTQREFEEVFADLGLRVLASCPVHNPWIVKNRFEGKARVTTLAGELLPFPPTNFLIAGEKVPVTEGVRFEERATEETPSFLTLTCFEHAATGHVRDLVYRPHPSLDVVPFFDADGDVMVIARRSYPRPILQCDRASETSLDGARPVGYVTEPLTVIQKERPLGQAAEALLERAARITPTDILEVFDGSVYYPSPGGIQEEVRSLLVRIEPVFVEQPLEHLSGASTSGQVRAMSAEQVLRAAQVGGLPDARLELNVYQLMDVLGRAVGPWLGDTLELSHAPLPERIVDVEAFVSRRRRRAFRPVATERSGSFLQITRASFIELNQAGEQLSELDREYVVPKSLSHNTIAVAVLRQSASELFLGLVDDDLPAVQAFSGSSDVWVTPAWRLPRGVTNFNAARRFVVERLEREHGLRCHGLWDLGGRYHPSPGLTPEAVYPIAVSVDAEEPAPFPLNWIRLKDLLRARQSVVDGHLRVVAWRAAHALNQLA